jgi:hypothetical protein
MKLNSIAAAILAILGLGIPPAASQAPDGAGKKRCQVVVKVVHGHKRKVKICQKPKPTVPKHVTFSLDSGHAARTEVAPGGGSVSARSAGGATFTLSVPASALPEAMTLKLTPVKAVTGFGSAKLAAAVQFEPEGLLLQEPATLTISLPRAAGSDLQAFTYSKLGQDFTLHPFTRHGNTVELRISHFSGAGVGTNLPKPDVDYLRIDAGTVRILLREAEKGPGGLFQRAAERYASWKQLVDRLPAKQRAKLAADVAELGRSFERALAHFTDEERKLCIEQHELSELTYINAMIKQLFGAGLLDESDALTELPSKCARFELTFDADIRWGFERSDLVIGETHVRVEKMPISGAHFEGGALVFNGAQAELNVLDHRPGGIVVQPGVNCYYTWEGGAHRQMPFVVKKLKIDIDKLPASPAATSAIGLTLLPGDFDANDYFNCPEAGVHDQVTDSVYSAGWMLLHAGDLLEGVAYLLDIDWDYSASELWARKTYDRVEHVPGNPGIFAGEKTTFELRHTPER